MLLVWLGRLLHEVQGDGNYDRIFCWRISFQHDRRHFSQCGVQRDPHRWQVGLIELRVNMCLCRAKSWPIASTGAAASCLPGMLTVIA